MVYDTELREALLAWLRANNVDPGNILEGGPLRLVGGQLETEVVVRHEAGGIKLDPFRPNQVLTEPATFAITVPPPQIVRDMFAGRRHLI